MVNNISIEMGNCENCLCFIFLFQLIEGKMKGIAFIKDPDGYWIEIFDLKTIGKLTSDAA